VIVQAGASDAGKRLASETAEAVFTAQSTSRAGRAFYADVKGRMEKLGAARAHEDPARLLGVVGETVEEAREKRARLDGLVNYANAVASLSIALGHDASTSIPTVHCPKSRRATRARAAASARSRWRSAKASRCASSRSGSAGSRVWR
jgi:alkanesulfonate monooxygenase SsuD/methylene tetrahydromethanopterin reductase-like flavin-dependent oxidoreductase (luciferase family)